MRRLPNYQGMDDSISGTAPELGNPGGQIDQDRILTSSGEAPTGDWARRHGSAVGIAPKLDDE
jgi:hypothetical protein